MLKLTYHATTSIPVEIEGFTPDFVRDKSVADLERWELFHGNEKLPLGDLFKLSGDPGDGWIEFEGNLAGVHWIGAHMTSGQIYVQGPAGRHVGSEMTGGEIHVAGDAGDWVGGEMHGGLIHVRGRAGHLIGSAYRGSRRGMTAGTILIHGDVGNEIGHTMRRGLLAVGGNCGDFPGINMIAGTVLVLGDCGIRPAPGMRRGTVGLLGSAAPQLLPTFRRGSTLEPLFLQLIFKELRRLDFTIPDEVIRGTYRIYHGDFVAGGRGEILTRDAA